MGELVETRSLLNFRTFYRVPSVRIGSLPPLVKLNEKIKILWASTREAYNYMQANNCKCDIITMPAKIIEKISMFGKSFRMLTLDTVKTFYKDASEANFKI